MNFSVRQAKFLLKWTYAFAQEQIQCLSALQATLEGKTERLKNPHSSRSLQWAAWLIARIGGWNPHSKDHFSN
ncbi:MAG: hypothetical protein HC880_19710 [Bacteroidia bacterium]|nr:hypothetical protein [Bacteroidia bacterium]